MSKEKKNRERLTANQREKIIDSVIDSFKDDDELDFFEDIGEQFKKIDERGIDFVGEFSTDDTIIITDEDIEDNANNSENGEAALSDSTALAEKSPEADEPDSSPAAPAQSQPKELLKPINRFYVTVAVIMLFFSVIGVVVSVNFVADRVEYVRDKKALKEEFARFVHPVVINDPPAFDSANNLQPSTIINSAIWKIILTDETDNYTKNEMGLMYIPEANVEKAAFSIFGIIPSEHESVSGSGVDFIHSKLNHCYEVPVNPTLFSYSPNITAVENEGSLYTVTVDYMMPSPLVIAGFENKNEPIKTMVYTISRTKEKTNIDSIHPPVDSHDRD